MKDYSIYLFCVVVWSVLVNDEFWGQKKHEEILVTNPVVNP